MAIAFAFVAVLGMAVLVIGGSEVVGGLLLAAGLIGFFACTDNPTQG